MFNGIHAELQHVSALLTDKTRESAVQLSTISELQVTTTAVIDCVYSCLEDDWQYKARGRVCARESVCESVCMCVRVCVHV